MKDKKFSNYATNKGGKITSPKGAPKGEPASVKHTGDDIRVKRG